MTLLVLPATMFLAAPSTVRGAEDGADDDAANDVISPSDPETVRYIVSVTGTSFGVSILLTGEGVSLGRSCDGAARLVRMASALYAELPADVRLRDDLLWANPTITREVLVHAWGASMKIPNGNPVDIVFADYTGESSTLQGAFWRSPLSALIRCRG